MLVLPEVVLPRLSGSLLADVVRRKKVTAGGLDGWGWREFCLFHGLMVLLASCLVWRILVFGLRVV